MGTKISRPLIAHIASKATPTALRNPPDAAAPALARNAEISVRLVAAATAAWAAAVSAEPVAPRFPPSTHWLTPTRFGEATWDRSRVASRPRPELSIVRKPSSRLFGPFGPQAALTKGHACESTGIRLPKPWLIKSYGGDLSTRDGTDEGRDGGLQRARVALESIRINAPGKPAPARLRSVSESGRLRRRHP